MVDVNSSKSHHRGENDFLAYEENLPQTLGTGRFHESQEERSLRFHLLLPTTSTALANHHMCEFCDLMPKEEGNDSTINHQVFGFFSPAAIEEAVQKHNAAQKKQEKRNEDDKQRPSSKNGSDSRKDDKAK